MPEHVAPIAPLDVPHVPEQVAPIAPVADSSPRKVSLTSSQSACSVDLLADCKSASSNSEWDYDERPLHLTQVSLKRSLDQGREEYIIIILIRRLLMRPPQVQKMPLFRRTRLMLPCLSLRCDGPRHGLQNAGLHLNSSVISAHMRLMCGVSCAA